MGICRGLRGRAGAHSGAWARVQACGRVRGGARKACLCGRVRVGSCALGACRGRVSRWPGRGRAPGPLAISGRPVQIAKRLCSLRLSRIGPFLGIWPVLYPGKSDPLRHRLNACLKLGRLHSALFGHFARHFGYSCSVQYAHFALESTFPPSIAYLFGHFARLIGHFALIYRPVWRSVMLCSRL